MFRTEGVSSLEWEGKSNEEKRMEGHIKVWYRRVKSVAGKNTSKLVWSRKNHGVQILNERRKRRGFWGKGHGERRPRIGITSKSKGARAVGEDSIGAS